MPIADSTPRRERRQPVTIVAWSAVVCLAPLCLAWVLGEWIYWLDLVASHQLLVGLVTLVLALPVLVLRRWRTGLTLVVLGCTAVYPVAVGRQWLLPEVDLDHKPAGVARVVSSNINPENPSWRDDFARLLELDADVIVLLEVHPELNRSIKNRGLLEQTPYRYWAQRYWVEKETSVCYILSRWPIRRLDAGSDLGEAQELLHVRVSRPAGELVVGAVHPLSPRTADRWSRGNRVTDMQARAAAQRSSETGLPVLLGVDLNAGPAQTRGRALRGAGLRMSKPLMRTGGSFPANIGAPAALMIQLDDVWWSGPVRPVAWGLLTLRGSDHRAVVADFEYE